MNVQHIAAWVVGTLCLLAGYSSMAASGEPPDPCSLHTQADVASALGAQVGAGRLATRKLCEWAVQGSPSLDAKKVMVTLVDANGFASAKMPMGHGVTKDLASGIGDEAVYGTTPHYATTLAVKKGDVYFIVQVWGFPIDPARAMNKVQEMEKILALEIVSRL